MAEWNERVVEAHPEVNWRVAYFSLVDWAKWVMLLVSTSQPQSMRLLGMPSCDFVPMKCFICQYGENGCQRRHGLQRWPCLALLMNVCVLSMLKSLMQQWFEANSPLTGPRWTDLTAQTILEYSASNSKMFCTTWSQLHMNRRSIHVLSIQNGKKVLFPWLQMCCQSSEQDQRHHLTHCSTHCHSMTNFGLRQPRLLVQVPPRRKPQPHQ